MFKKEGAFKSRGAIVEFIKFVVITIVIVVPIRLWVAQPFIVSGSSMEPNFSSGEYLIIDEFSYHFRQPQRGEVVVFRFPENPSKFFIKRVIALPNETIEIRNNKVIIYNNTHPNGFVLDESYINRNTVMSDMKMKLGPDQYFVMGDNRLMSLDSRRWGALTENFIVGRALLRLWPVAVATAYLPGQN